MSFIDPRTVVLLTGIMSGLMSLVLFSLKRNYPPSIKGLGHWSAGLLVLFIGALMFSVQGQLPGFIAFPVSNLVLWCGLYLIYMGSEHFFGLTPRMGPWLALLAVGLLVMSWFTLIDPSYHVRLVFSTLLRGFLLGMMAWLVLRQGANTFARVLAVCVLSSATAVQLMRVVTSFVNPVGSSIFDTDPFQLIYITSYAFLIFLLSISLVLLASERLRTELEHLATHDSLTNALNRRYINEACNKELERCRRHGRSMALIMMDLDHFKAINDSYGHQAGDQVLVNFVAKINALLRQPDLLGRFGGEEFVVLLPETSLEEALIVTERIREVCILNKHEPSCTVSMGMTTNNHDSDTVDTLMGRADGALYRAKANGRDRVETA